MPYLKRREIKLLEILKKHVTVKDAQLDIQQELNFSLRATYNILYRIRMRQVEARNFVNQMLVYRRQSMILDKLLSPKVRAKDEPLDEEGEE